MLIFCKSTPFLRLSLPLDRFYYQHILFIPLFILVYNGVDKKPLLKRALFSAFCQHLFSFLTAVSAIPHCPVTSFFNIC